MQISGLLRVIVQRPLVQLVAAAVCLIEPKSLDKRVRLFASFI